MTKISDKSADNQSGARISVAYNKNCHCHWWQVLWNATLVISPPLPGTHSLQAILFCRSFACTLHSFVLFLSGFPLKIKLSSGHAIALWEKRCGIDQKRLIIYMYHTQVLVCAARFWNHQNDKKFGPVLVKYTERCIWDYATRAWHVRYIYQVQIDIILYHIYQLVGSFSAKFVSLHVRISQNIFFHIIGNKSFHFIFWEGPFKKGNMIAI